MGYATYDDYLLLYGGSRLTEDEFLSAAEDASAEVDRYVFGRISAGAEITTDVKKAVCAAAEAIIDRQASMSRGSVSVSYTHLDVYKRQFLDSAALRTG